MELHVSAAPALHVLVAAVVAWLIGALWYSPVMFAKAWVKAHGYTPEQLAAMQVMQGKVIGLTLVAMILMAWILGMFLNHLGADSVADGVKWAFHAWLDFGRPIARGRDVSTLTRVRAGDLVVAVAASPTPTISVHTRRGELVQTLTLDAVQPGMTFLLPTGPLLGLGEGGPQFDRKGSTDSMRNGQGGYRLATHGTRAPVQWLVGTDGWAMFIHQPYGAFDFTGTEANFTPTVLPDPGT